MRSPGNRRFSTSRMALLSVLLSCALVLGLAERAIPPVVSLPGVRLGLPNAAVLLILYLFPFPEVLVFTVLKCLLLSLLTGSFPSLAYSLSGSILSLCAMFPVIRLSKERISPVGVSIVGAVCHNVGQLLCASVLMGTFLFPYLPMLLLSGALSGAAVGWAVTVTLPRVRTLKWV